LPVVQDEKLLLQTLQVPVMIRQIFQLCSYFII
jgi:hypothetical protein